MPFFPDVSWPGFLYCFDSKYLESRGVDYALKTGVCKGHESMDPSCLVSTVQAGGGGVMVWGIFSWHTLGPLVPIEHHLNATAYLSIVADHVILWTPCPKGIRQCWKIMVATQNIDTLDPIWTFSLRGVLTFVASGLDINGCVLSYFEGTANLHFYTSCTLTSLHCSKVSFLQCCHMKRYNKIFTEMWGVYSLLWDNVCVCIYIYIYIYITFLSPSLLKWWLHHCSRAFKNIRNRCHTPIGLHTQTKPIPRYFRQYRNPSQDASGKNGMHEHPIIHVFAVSFDQINASLLIKGINFFTNNFWPETFEWCVSECYYDVSFTV